MTKEDMLQRAAEKGALAFQAGKTLDDCPYTSVNNPFGIAWVQGFESAQLRRSTMRLRV